MSADNEKYVDIEVEIDDDLYEFAERMSRELGYEKVEDYLRDLLVDHVEREMGKDKNA
ncbi:hypothetical protein [Sulfitobacter sp. R18_1]|uniref:hypothetical protein n=1 Tax=Sulfitobacter sp. R18_1 TaxID=2821104 RepID=UPI001ADAB84C|nr:hypothetical protein [Sulfitobacter sp. R18_1]MBO9428128.1 hypothetical protein [Sulfitobacter sp. R18_1]